MPWNLCLFLSISHIFCLSSAHFYFLFRIMCKYKWIVQIATAIELCLHLVDADMLFLKGTNPIRFDREKKLKDLICWYNNKALFTVCIVMLQRDEILLKLLIEKELHCITFLWLWLLLLSSSCLTKTMHINVQRGDTNSNYMRFALVKSKTHAAKWKCGLCDTWESKKWEEADDSLNLLHFILHGDAVDTKSKYVQIIPRIRSRFVFLL